MTTDPAPTDQPVPTNPLLETLRQIMEKTLHDSEVSQAATHKTPLANALVRAINEALPGAEIDFRYSGSGDSGWFDGFDVFFPGDGNRTPTDSEWKKIDEIKAASDMDKIEQELYEILESRAPGWEINEGSQGTFRFSVDGRRSQHHEENIVEVNVSEWEF